MKWEVSHILTWMRRSKEMTSFEVSLQSFMVGVKRQSAHGKTHPPSTIEPEVVETLLTVRRNALLIDEVVEQAYKKVILCKISCG